MLKKSFISLIFVLITLSCYAQHDHLRKEIAEIVNSSSGKIGVSIMLLEDNDTLNYHNEGRYVMQSVFKFAIALTVLHEIDEHRLGLEEKVHITQSDLPDTYSPLRDKYKTGNINVSIKELLTYMVTLSDNDACDILIKQLGGTKKVDKFIHHLGIDSLAIKVTEAEMAASWSAQYKNWCRPSEQIKLLNLIYHQSILTKNNNDFLWRLMLTTYTGPNRLRSLLPNGTPLAHRTGTSGINAKGLAPGTNDIGIIVLPDGRHLAIAIFVMDSYDGTATRDLIIAKLGKVAYDEFATKKL